MPPVFTVKKSSSYATTTFIMLFTDKRVNSFKLYEKCAAGI